MIPMSEASMSSEGTGVPGCSSSWCSSEGIAEAAASGEECLAEHEEYAADLLSNGLPWEQQKNSNDTTA